MTRSLRAPAGPVEGPDGSEGSEGPTVSGGPDVPEGPVAPEGLDRFRIVLAAAMGTVIVTYAMLVPGALLIVLAGGGADSSVDGAFAAAIPLWLAAHLIPLELEGQPLSVLPLLLPLAVIAVVSVGARWAVRRLGGRFRHDAGAVIAAAAGAHAAVAVLGSALLPNAAQVGAAPWAAMVGAGLVAAVGAAIGVLRGCAVPAAWVERLRGPVAAGLAGAAVGGVALTLLGAVALLVGLIFGAARAHAMFEALTPTGGGALGLTLLCLAYLPNAVLGGAAWLLGAGVDVGLGAWTPFGGAPGPLPPFPLLAALPTVPSPAWAVVVVLVPVAVGLAVGGICRSASGAAATTVERLRAVGVATGVLVVAAVVLVLVAGGRLSAGDFDPVAIPVGYVLPAVVVWIGGPAAVVALVQRGGAPDAGRDEDLEWYRDGWSDDRGSAGDADDAHDADAHDADAHDADAHDADAHDADYAQDTDYAGDADDIGDAGDAESADRDGAGPGAAGRDVPGPDGSDLDAADGEVSGSGSGGSDTEGSDTGGSGRDDSERGDSAPGDSDGGGRDGGGRDGAGRGGAGRGGAGRDTADGGGAGRDATDREGAGRGDAGPQEAGAGRGAAAGRPSAGPRVRRGSTRRDDRNAAVDAARRRREARLARGSATEVPAPRADDPGDRRGPFRRKARQRSETGTPARTEPEHREPTRSEPEHREPTRSEPTHREPTHRDLEHPRPAQAPQLGSPPVGGTVSEAEPAPRTVAELVALRKRQAEAAAAEASSSQATASDAAED